MHVQGTEIDDRRRELEDESKRRQDEAKEEKDNKKENKKEEEMLLKHAIRVISQVHFPDFAKLD